VPSTPDFTDLSARRGPGWWQCLAVARDGKPVWVAAVLSDRHPAGAHVELIADAAQREVGVDGLCTAEFDENGAVGALRVGARGAPKAPPLWFVEVRESAASPPAVSLVAFTEHGVPAGSLLAETDIGSTSATSADQVGAARWYPATGEVDQIYVQPQWRRRTVGRALVVAAGTLAYARNWPKLWADGQRTQLGEQFRNASPWWHRAHDLTHLSPPMTPSDLEPG
jgi:GNAT superfamily N-acetyltransferase